MSGQINDSVYLLIVTFAVLIVISIRRVKHVNRGSKINVRNTVFFSAYYVAVASILVYNSFFVASISLLYILPYSIVVVAAMFGSYLYSKKSILFWKLTESGVKKPAIYAKGGIVIYLSYVIALVIRVLINIFIINSSTNFFNFQAFQSYNTTAFPSNLFVAHIQPTTSIVLALIITDFLLMIGTGLLIGRNARVLMHYYQ